MVKIKINESAFASELKSYFNTHQFDSTKVDSTLRTCIAQCKQSKYSGVDHACNGLRFGYTGELMLLLIERAFNELEHKVRIDEYCAGIARSMQHFANGFKEKDADLCYSHFLMHAINQSLLEKVINKIENNARIIHETQAELPNFISSLNPPVQMSHDLKLGFDRGQTDDYFGICNYMYDESLKYASGCSDYIAKFSIFLDVTNKIVYGFTVQGRMVEKKKMPNGQYEKDKEKGRDFLRLTAKIGMDPRAFVIKTVADIAHAKGYSKIKILKPEHHPMFIERHAGFTGKYLPIIKQAGIQKENGYYLERDLI